jgi:hypothetical protein
MQLADIGVKRDGEKLVPAVLPDDMMDLGEESGFACMVCQEGYTAAAHIVPRLAAAGVATTSHIVLGLATGMSSSRASSSASTSTRSGST